MRTSTRLLSAPAGTCRLVPRVATGGAVVRLVVDAQVRAAALAGRRHVRRATVVVTIGH